MSTDRSRPWQNPTPLRGFQPAWAGQFDTFNDWVRHATIALARELDSNGLPLTSFCVDAKGRRCHNGKDFMRARDEDAFPVRYFFTSTVSGRAARAATDLTAREAEVMAMVEQGTVNKAIARALGLSVRTVEAHRLNARKKLRASEQRSAAA